MHKATFFTASHPSCIILVLGLATHWFALMAHRGNALRLGDDAELLVVSSTPTFAKFTAIKEAYCPQTGSWLANYPYINR